MTIITKYLQENSISISLHSQQGLSKVKYINIKVKTRRFNAGLSTD